MNLYYPCKEYPKVYGIKCASENDGLNHISLFTSLDDAIVESNVLWRDHHIHNEIVVFPLIGGLIRINKDVDDEIQK